MRQGIDLLISALWIPIFVAIIVWSFGADQDGARSVKVQKVEVPCLPGGALPSLTLNHSGIPLISWVDREEDGTAVLKFAQSIDRIARSGSFIFNSINLDSLKMTHSKLQHCQPMSSRDSTVTMRRPIIGDNVDSSTRKCNLQLIYHSNMTIVHRIKGTPKHGDGLRPRGSHPSVLGRKSGVSKLSSKTPLAFGNNRAASMIIQISNAIVASPMPPSR